MSYTGSRPLNKRNAKGAEFGEDAYDWENHLIMRLPPDVAAKVHNILDEKTAADERESLAIQLTSMDMRHAKVRIGNHLMSGKIHDLPCISEVHKTVDKKNIYKVADLSQIMICSHELIEPPPDTGETIKSSKKEQKQWHLPHGLTAPMKSVRRRRFRKTKKKKYMDAPEVEKELKRLLRADQEAASIKWEIVSAEDKKKDTAVLNDQSLFGDKVTSSEDEDSQPPQLVNDNADEKDD